MAPQPFIPLTQGAQAEIKFLLFGEVVENRLWFRARFVPFDATAIQLIADGVAAWHIDQVLPLLSRDLNLFAVVATDWSAFPTPAQYASIHNEFGGVDDDSHSANVAVRVLFKGTSDQTFPSNSHFVPGIPRSAVEGNYYTAEFRDALFEAYAALPDLARNWGVGHNIQWVITSRRLDNAWRTTQEWSRTDFIRFPSPTVSPRRRRLP